MPNYGGESSGPSDLGGGNYGSGGYSDSGTGESDYNPNRTGREFAPQVYQPPPPPPENPLFALARQQAQNDMMGWIWGNQGGGFGQGYQAPQMNPMQTYDSSGYQPFQFGQFFGGGK